MYNNEIKTTNKIMRSHSCMHRIGFVVFTVYSCT